MISLTINGQTLEVPEGYTVLKAAESAGVVIPTLCYHHDLSPLGGCRLCVVEVQGARLPMTSCVLPVSPGLVVQTESPALTRYRQAVLRMLLTNYYDAGYKRVNGRYDIDQDNELAHWAHIYGIDISEAMARRPSLPVDSDPNPFVWVDMNKCIQCLRCVRACGEIQGRFVWSQSYRGYRAKIVAGANTTMLQARCESCGACVAYCPTGALDNKMSVNAGRADRLVRTTCAYCGVGCQFDLNVKDDVSGGRILRVTSNTDPSVHSFNAMHLCLKGRYGYDFVHHKDRLTRPRVRRYLLEGEQRPKDRGKWVDVDWETAIEVSAQGLHHARDEFGGESVAVLASGKLTNEENYLLNKLARQVLSTNHIDCASHIYHASVVDGLAEVAGLHGMSNTLDDIASNAQALLVIGSNLTEQHPVFGARIRQAIMRRKVKMVVISPDFINIAEYAALPLYHRQKTETALLNGLMHIILERGWEDKSAVENQPQGFSEYKIKLARYTPGYVAEITGVSEDSLYQAAEIMALNRPMAVLWSTGVADFATGRGNIQCLVNLQRLLGNLDKSGGGLNPLRGQNNIQGACDMGALPGMLPGYQSVADPVICQKFEQAWGVPLPSQPGLNAVEFLAAARDGRLKAIYILGEDILNTSADAASVRRSLESCDFTVLQEILPSETTRYADVLLPGVSFVEKNGTFTSTERRIQTVQQAIKPIGKARLDWEIISDLAQRIIAIGGRNLEQAPFSAWDYASVDQIQQEIAQLTPIYAGISPDRLAGGEQVHWPVISAMHPGSPLLKTELGGWEAVEQISLPERIIV